MKEWLRRALRTFVQAALGFASANVVAYISGVDFNDTSTISVAITGLIAATIAAGCAAVMNLDKKIVVDDEKIEEDEEVLEEDVV